MGNLSDTEHFSINGFVPPQSVSLPHQIEQIQAAIDDVTHNAPTCVILEKDDVTPRSLVNPHHFNSVLYDVAHDKRIAEVASRLLGSDVYVFQLGINLKQPFSGDIWYWHRDYPTYHQQDHIPSDRMVNVLIYLDDFNRDNGSFMVVPTTHQDQSQHGDMATMGTSHALHYAGQKEMREAIEGHGITFVDAPKGSAVFMNTNILHASGANLSSSPRRLITLTLNSVENKAMRRSHRPDLVDDDCVTPGILTGEVQSPST